MLIPRLREEGLQRQRAIARSGTSPEPASVLDADNEREEEDDQEDDQYGLTA